MVQLGTRSLWILCGRSKHPLQSGGRTWTGMWCGWLAVLWRWRCGGLMLLRFVWLESWWWRCHWCGCSCLCIVTVLPCNAVIAGPALAASSLSGARCCSLSGKVWEAVVQVAWVVHEACGTSVWVGQWAVVWGCSQRGMKRPIVWHWCHCWCWCLLGRGGLSSCCYYYNGEAVVVVWWLGQIWVCMVVCVAWVAAVSPSDCRPSGLSVLRGSSGCSSSSMSSMRSTCFLTNGPHPERTVSPCFHTTNGKTQSQVMQTLENFLSVPRPFNYRSRPSSDHIPKEVTWDSRVPAGWKGTTDFWICAFATKHKDHEWCKGSVAEDGSLVKFCDLFTWFGNKMSNISELRS